MTLTYQERQELNAMSEKAFGSQSKWKKLLDNGYYETWTRDREAMVPGPDGKMDKRTFTDKKYVSKYPTVEEIRKYMVDEIEKRSTTDAAALKALKAAIAEKPEADQVPVIVDSSIETS